MQFGLFMMPLHPPERSFTESYDRDLAQPLRREEMPMQFGLLRERRSCQQTVSS